MIIADTGFFYAVMNSKDKYHQKAKNILRNLDEPLITTWCVLTETCHLLLSRKGIRHQNQFINSIDPDLIEIFPLNFYHLSRITDLLEQYADLPMDLADASLVVLAEHLSHGRIPSTDQRDFGIYRWKNTHPFQNLLT
jgi:predicted nucleic acid-binding protein